MNILFTICGRAGSKGFKNKNLKLFAGCPLVYYSLAEISLYMKKLTGDKVDIVLNTDSHELIRLVEQQNVVDCDYIVRADELSGDYVPKVSVIRDCMIQISEKKNQIYDVVVDLDITSPIRTLADLEKLLDLKRMQKEADVIFSVVESRRNPYFNMVKEEEGTGFYCRALTSDFATRQQAPIFFDMNASMYAYSPAALINKPANIFFNDKCGVLFMKDTGILDVDSEEDYELLQVIAQYLYTKYEPYAEVYEEAMRIEKS